MTDVGAHGNRERETSRDISFDERVIYQRAIEEVYWRHRIWPAGNSGPRPDLSEAMSEAVMREKVEDYLQKSAALERYWQRPISAEQLQAEITRMAANSKQPDLLRELWAALDNDPGLIAECLARPVLAERLIRNWYAYEERFHGELKARAEAELGRIQTPDLVSTLSGQRYEEEWVRGSSGVNKDTRRAAVSTLTADLTSDEWEARVQSLVRMFKAVDEQSLSTLPADQARTAAKSASSGELRGDARLEEVPVGRLSGLAEGEDGFSVIAVTARSADRLRVAGVVWRKEPFESWWSNARSDLGTALTPPDYDYRLTQLALNGSTDDWTATVSSAPVSRYNHSAVWTGSEMIIWGGLDSSSCCGNGPGLNTGGRYNPATDTWIPTSILNAPTPRYLHTAVWTGTEMLVWGGQDISNRFNTGGRYNPATNTWTGINTAGAPGARTSHTVVWTGSEMIIWGGQDSSSCCTTPFNTGGRYNPASDSWTATNSLIAPSGRSFHSAVWTGGEMIVWGGQDSNSNRSNTGGRYNPASNTWAGVNTTGAPTGRVSHTAVWTGSEMIVWGGGANTCCGGANTGGKYNPATDAWAATSTVGAADGRASHTAIWTGSVMIIWGGNTNSSSSTTGARYTPETDSWTATSTTNVPSGRSLHTAVWTGSEMIIWGGSNASPGNSGGRYNPEFNVWIATSIAVAPSGRERHTAVWTGSEMIIWGGFGPITNFSSTVNTPLNTGNRYLPATDSWLPVSTNSAPTARHNHTAVWTGSGMIVWGGYDGSIVLLTGSRYNPSTNSWTSTSGINAPLPRFLHTAVWTGSEMIVWGGTDGFNYFNSGGRYNAAANTWMPTSTTSAPAARSSQTAVWAGNEMIVWGGFNSALGYLNTGGRYNALTDGWTAINDAGAPAPRINHTAIWSGSEMIVWGGFDGDSHLGTGARYMASGDSWMPVAAANSPSARSLHSAVFTGNEMIVWGGFDGNSYLDTGARYNIPGNDWTPTTAEDAPSARHRHTAVWTGNEMIVWGGFDGVNHLVTGGRYSTGVAGGCSFTASPMSVSLAADGGARSINVTATSGCGWSATSNEGWVSITTGAGNGDGIVNILVAPNPGSGVRTAMIRIGNADLTVAQGPAFADVPSEHPFFDAIGKLAARGITVGCGQNVQGQPLFCPGNVITREQMAVFIIRALGEFDPPQPTMQRFTDVPPENPFYAFIEEMAARGITSGCGGGNYCPGATVTREQMSVFIIRALGEFNPPQPTMQRFMDVPPENPFYGFVEEMAVRGITSGCGGGNFCPGGAVTRDQMAAFIVRAFGL